MSSLRNIYLIGTYNQLLQNKINKSTISSTFKILRITWRILGGVLQVYNLKSSSLNYPTLSNNSYARTDSYEVAGTFNHNLASISEVIE